MWTWPKVSWRLAQHMGLTSPLHVGYLLGKSCGHVVLCHLVSLFLIPIHYAWYLSLVAKGVS